MEPRQRIGIGFVRLQPREKMKHGRDDDDCEDGWDDGKNHDGPDGRHSHPHHSHDADDNGDDGLENDYDTPALENVQIIDDAPAIAAARPSSIGRRRQRNRSRASPRRKPTIHWRKSGSKSTTRLDCWSRRRRRHPPWLWRLFFFGRRQLPRPPPRFRALAHHANAQTDRSRTLGAVVTASTTNSSARARPVAQFPAAFARSISPPERARPSIRRVAQVPSHVGFFVEQPCREPGKAIAMQFSQ
jgi:hypothetical protein